MNNLKHFNRISYDTMIIIYYCFNIKNHRITELTKKAQILTKFLTDNDIRIIIPTFILTEIIQKGIRNIVDETIDNKQITNLPQNPTIIFKLGLEFKIRQKLLNLQQKDWFIVESYNPPKEQIDEIGLFFKHQTNHPNIDEFLKRKHRTNPIPSLTDMKLIGFSGKREIPIITNDCDLTFFAEELLKEGLSNRIFDFAKLEIYNN